MKAAFVSRENLEPILRLLIYRGRLKRFKPLATILIADKPIDSTERKHCSGEGEQLRCVAYDRSRTINLRTIASKASRMTVRTCTMLSRRSATTTATF